MIYNYRFVFHFSVDRGLSDLIFDVSLDEDIDLDDECSPSPEQSPSVSSKSPSKNEADDAELCLNEEIEFL